MTTITLDNVHYITYDGLTVNIIGVPNRNTLINIDVSIQIRFPSPVKFYTVVMINDLALRDCINLKTIKISNNMHTIGSNAFINCTSLEAINLPNSITNIYKGAFQNCTSLTTIILPDKLIKLENELFKNCNKLHSIIIPDSVLLFGLNVFSDCKALEIIVLPDSLTVYGDTIFNGCTTLQDVIFTGTISISSQLHTNLTKINNAYIYEIYNTTLNRNYLSKFFTNINFIVERHGVIYSINNNTATIISADRLALEYLILDNINGKTVTSIAKYAFDCCALVSEIIIPNTIVNISKYAFLNCTSLKKLIIPGSVISISEYIFNGCNLLIDVVFTGSNIPTINVNGIRSNKITNVFIKETVNITQQNILQTYFQNVIITKPSVTKDKIIYEIDVINNLAIIIGNTDNSINTFTLYDRIEYDGFIYIVKKIGINAFIGCNITNLTIPNTIETIENNAFTYCSSLSRITLSNSLIELGTGIFSTCYELQEVNIPNSVIKIGVQAFANCKITRINIPDSVISIGQGAFYDCQNLMFVSLSNNINVIESSVFYGCSSMQEIYIPGSITLIKALAFYLTSLLRVYFDGHVPNIEQNAFSINKIDNAYVFDYYYNETLYDDINDNIIYDLNSNTYRKIPEYTNIQDDVITASSTSSQCVRKNLFQFTLPFNIKSLKLECKVRTVRQPSTDAYIVFKNNTTGKTQHLRSTNFLLNTLWSNVTLSSMDLLNSGYLRADVEPLPGHDIEIYAEACFPGWRIDVKESVLIYTLYEKLTDVFNTINIRNVLTTTTINNIVYEYDTNTKYASIININANNDYIIFPPNISINNEPYTLISINEPACFKDNLIAITLPDTITTIDSFCFKNCINLVNVVLPKYITYIYANMFSNCINLTNITLPDNILCINKNAFDDCFNLKYIIWPSLLKTICNNAFNDCKSLINLILPDTIEYIGSGAFSGCRNINKIHFPLNLKFIGSYAFNKCTSLTNIEIPPITHIGSAIFIECSNLETAIFTSDIIHIDHTEPIVPIFNYCYKLRNVYINRPSLDSLMPYVFGNTYSSQLIVHISLFSLPPIRKYKYNTYPTITYEYFRLGNFLIGTRDQQPYNYNFIENLSINKYIMSENQFIYIPNECTIYNKKHIINYILNNTFSNAKIVVFPTTKFIIEENAFSNAEHFIFTGEIPELNNTTKYENVYISRRYNTPDNIIRLQNYFTNVYIRFPMGVTKHTHISCFVNNNYRNVHIHLLKPGNIVRTLNGDRTIIRILRTRTTQDMYISDNLTVSPYVGILKDKLNENNICYGKINDDYIVSANTVFTRRPTIRTRLVYNIVFDTTEEFTCYYANNIPIVTPVILL